MNYSTSSNTLLPPGAAALKVILLPAVKSSRVRPPNRRKRDIARPFIRSMAHLDAVRVTDLVTLLLEVPPQRALDRLLVRGGRARRAPRGVDRVDDVVEAARVRRAVLGRGRGVHKGRDVVGKNLGVVAQGDAVSCFLGTCG